MLIEAETGTGLGKQSTLFITMVLAGIRSGCLDIMPRHVELRWLPRTP